MKHDHNVLEIIDKLKKGEPISDEDLSKKLLDKVCDYAGVHRARSKLDTLMRLRRNYAGKISEQGDPGVHSDMLQG